MVVRPITERGRAISTRCSIEARVEERLHRDVDAREDRAAQVLALGGDAVEGGGGAEVDGDHRRAHELEGGDRVHDAVGADLARVLVADRACPVRMPGPDHEGRARRRAWRTRAPRSGAAAAPRVERIASVTSPRGRPPLRRRARAAGSPSSSEVCSRRVARRQWWASSSLSGVVEEAERTFVLPTSTARSTASLTARAPVRRERHVAGEDAHHRAVVAPQPQRAVGVDLAGRRPASAAPPGSDDRDAAARHAVAAVEARAQRREAAARRGASSTSSRVP